MKVIICGITGTIGTQTLEVIDNTNHELIGITFNKNTNKLIEILNKYKFKNISIFSPSVKEFNTHNSFKEMILDNKPDYVVNAVSGFAGLEITKLCLENNIDIGLANKESFVVAGWYLKKILLTSKSKIYPIDSEHSAIYDLIFNNKKNISNFYITASGGRYYNKNIDELNNVKFNDAIKHPNWNMGYKISIDSSTLMNKCFEIIECFYLYNTKNIKALYHPESIVHAMVEFEDNTIFAHMSQPDMKFAINLAINKYDLPKANKSHINKLNFCKLKLNFDEIDTNIHKPIKWAYDFINNPNKVIGSILLISNDYAVELFKEEKITFNLIILIIENCIKQFKDYNINNIEDIYRLKSEIESYIKNNFV